MRNLKIKFFLTTLALVASCAVNALAQSFWLDQNPLPSWNERSRAILQTKKISAAESKRCAVAVRQPSLPQDFLLTKMNWTLVGAAQVHGKTTVVCTA